MEPLLNIVLPVFAIVGAGYLCGVRGLLGEDSSVALNRFVYWVALPALLFRSMARVEIGDVLNLSFIAGFLGALLLLWLVAALLARLLFGSNLTEATLHGMNGVYGNSGYMGIPLAITAYGEAAALPAIVATVINTAVVVGIAITVIELGAARRAGSGGTAGRLVRSLAFNPMLAAPALGLGYALTGLALPVPVDAFTSLLGAAAGPCALFAIGLFLVGKPTSEGRTEVGVMMAMKLIGQPLVTALMVFVLLPTDLLWAKIAVLMAALPTGAGSFVLAQAYGIYVLRTSSAILAGTVVSVGTLTAFFWFFPPGG